MLLFCRQLLRQPFDYAAILLILIISAAMLTGFRDACARYNGSVAAMSLLSDGRYLFSSFRFLRLPLPRDTPLPVYAYALPRDIHFAAARPFFFLIDIFAAAAAISPA